MRFFSSPASAVVCSKISLMKLCTVSSTDVPIFDSRKVVYYLCPRIPCYNLRQMQELVLDVHRVVVISFARMSLLVAIRRSSGDLQMWDGRRRY